MPTEKPTRIVTATIKSKAEAEDGWKVELDIPEFKSNFPTFCTRVEPEVAALLSPGETHRLRLEQQKLKANKDGAFPSHYYWGLLGVVTAPAPRKPPEAPGSPPEAPLPWPQAQTRESSIEAQVAAYCTAQVMAALWENLQGDMNSSIIGELILEFYQGMQRAKHTGAAAQPTEASPNSPTESKTPTAATTDSARPGPEEDTPFPEPSAPLAPKPVLPYMPPEEFRKAWAEAGLPTKAGPALTKLLQSLTEGQADTIGKALSLGWKNRELLEAAKKVQV